MFTEIGDLLREDPIPAKVRAALYLVAARIPGIQVLGLTHDAIGRPALAVALNDTLYGERSELLFDPKTSALVGERSVVVKPPPAYHVKPGTVHRRRHVRHRGNRRADRAGPESLRDPVGGPRSPNRPANPQPAREPPTGPRTPNRPAEPLSGRGGLLVRTGCELVDQRRQPQHQVWRELLLGRRQRGVERPLASPEPLLLGARRSWPCLVRLTATARRSRSERVRRTIPRRSSASRMRVAVDALIPAAAASSWTRAARRLDRPSSRPYWDSVRPPSAV